MTYLLLTSKFTLVLGFPVFGNNQSINKHCGNSFIKTKQTENSKIKDMTKIIFDSAISLDSFFAREIKRP